MLNQKLSVIYLLMSFAMLSWAVAWTSAKIVNNYLSFYNLIFLRFTFGFVFLIPFILNKNIIKKISLQNLKYIIITSILFFIYNIAFFKGTYYGLAGKGAILVTTINPLITLIIMSIINKKISKNEILGMSFGFIGGMIIIDIVNEGIGSIILLENIYFLICAITWGIITVLTNYGQKTLDSYTFIFSCYLLTAFIAIFYIDFSEFNVAKLDWKFYFNFFIVSIGAMAIGTSIYIYATKILGPIKSSAFIFSVPFLAITTSYIFLNEPLTVNVTIGGILSLIGVYLANK